MFRIQFFCEDKKLADSLRSLTGLAAGHPEVHPVVNAVHKNGKVQAANGSLEEQFIKHAKSKKLDKFKAADLDGFCKEAGLMPSSRGYLLKKLVKAGSIRKYGVGAGVTYKVNA